MMDILNNMCRCDALELDAMELGINTCWGQEYIEYCHKHKDFLLNAMSKKKGEKCKLCKPKKTIEEIISLMPPLPSLVIIKNRPPTMQDICDQDNENKKQYDIGAAWIYSLKNEVYILTSITKNGADWKPLFA